MNELTKMETNNAIVNESGCFMVANSGHASYCSMIPKTPAERKAVFNAINSPSKSLRDFINKTIKLKHVFAEQCEFVDQNTGETVPGVRVVLIDEKGESYSTCSTGVFNGLSKLFSFYGTPDIWSEPVPITIKQITKSANKAVLVIEIA